jgi:site-specific DNA-methyltransferase (adenine-specific)
MRQIPDASIDVVITDPPFGINYQNTSTAKKHEVLAGDGSNFSYLPLAKEAYRVLKPDTAILCFTGWSEYPKHFPELAEAGFKMKEPLIGRRRPSMGCSFSTWQPNADWVMFGHKGKFLFRETLLMRNKNAGATPNGRTKPVGEYKRRFPSCWFGEEFPSSSENPSFQRARDLLHPTIKGLEFIEWLIQLTTDAGGVVLDPFLGSGTTAEAARNTGRHFIGCDIKPEFCVMAQRRLAEPCCDGVRGDR